MTQYESFTKKKPKDTIRRLEPPEAHSHRMDGGNAMMLTFYCLCRNHLGQSLGIYVDAPDMQSAWDIAAGRRETDSVIAIQLLAGLA